MERNTIVRTVLPIVTLLIALTSLFILTGLASDNPDGFEWALFSWAGVEEPSPYYSGLFSFLGDGPIADVIAGSVGIFIVLLLAFAFFKFSSRKAE